MAEAELHRERLQAIAEKRKRQTAIEDKRQQLDDQILQLQHLKSKSLREKWLLQGVPTGSVEEEEARRKQCEEDEKKLKILEDNVHRLEQDIEQLESEESLISAKEQILREKLKETEISFEDLQKSLSNQDKDAVSYIYSQIPEFTNLNSHKPETPPACDGATRVATLCAMEINVEKDRKTGETRILSTSPIDPESVHQRGVKVYDDGNKVVYEVHHAGTVVENGVHKLSTRDVDNLIQKTAQTNVIRGKDRETLPERTVIFEGNPIQGKEQMHFKEAKLELVHKSNKGLPSNPGNQHARSGRNELIEPTLEQPVTMIFMGYQNIDDEEETKKVLGYDDTIKAELVLIDEDDEKSLREKTVTDVSTMDGNAAELVSGKQLTETTEPSSPEGKEESLATEPVTELKKKSVQFKDIEEMEGEISNTQEAKPHISEDDIKLRNIKDQNSANLPDPADLILTSKETMEIEVQASEHKGVTLVTPDDPVDNQATLLSVIPSQNGLKDRHESIDSDVAKEIQYLDEVLEANCCDTSTDNPFNGSSSPEPTTIRVDGSGPHISVTNETFTPELETISVDRKKFPAVGIFELVEEAEQIKINGHCPSDIKHEPTEVFTYPTSPNSSNSSRRSSKDGDITPKIIKKEAKFELRAFHEEKKPSKLFEDFNEREHIRVRKVRPSEEVVELEKERLELIRSQAVKKNPGIATKWWNPPQEKTLEEQLDSDHLESHMKYKERKEKLQQQATSPPPIKSNTTEVITSVSTAVNKEDIVTEQIDFSAARKQFLNMENTSQSNFKAPPKRSNLYSVKPFYKVNHGSNSQSSITVTNQTTPCFKSVHVESNEMPLLKAEKVNCISEDQQMDSERYLLESTDDFLSATATLTVVRDDENDLTDRFTKSITVSSLPEELDSGLDDLSLKSQDTTIMETLSNDFSMDNISDSGASIETMNALHESSLGDFSQPQTPLNDETPSDYALEKGSKSFSDQGFYSPSSTLRDSTLDDQLEYHAGILVQNVIQQALAEKAGITGCTNSECLSDSKYIESDENVKEPSVFTSSPTQTINPENCHDSAFEPPQVSSPVQDARGVTVTPKTPEPEKELRPEKFLQPLSINPEPDDTFEEIKHESYFSKYSQAAELRSTASILATQESEITVGPFKLRSKKQRTLSMIEEEIRAAQEREQELKRQRQSLSGPQSPSGKTPSVAPVRTVSYKTAPGKIEKVKTPTSPRGECFPTQPDELLEEGAGSQRPKNLMQTLMDDFETHKSKRRDKMDDSSVLEAVRVNRRKSALALRWEAGIYANREEDE
ncbi:PALM2-AKAP2 fusion protein isoform X1 [Pelobates fuscus]|uniref:PALM2-AKAP2 fusion protein isoform X1 n=3 Tax=Pelobates fuscus TaxID=191477 RepID=UPI002FE4ADF5